VTQVWLGGLVQQERLLAGRAALVAGAGLQHQQPHRQPIQAQLNQSPKQGQQRKPLQMPWR
jgi:hypothetical protein